ncbi:MAG TPA: hypothetical protein VFC19_36560 [Candidatus Limnocylindrales bacterium]|nr:hypothetical protein [Candidatus Limnocylindrales bacterium]
MNERAPLGRLALGATVLAGQRLRLLGKPVPETLAVLVGVAERGRDTARHALRRAEDTAKKARDTAKNVSPRPPKRVREFLDEARSRGTKTIRVGQLEAKGWFARTMDDSIRWAERNVIPRVVDDMTPHIVKNVVPKVISGVMPQIRTQVVPMIIEDLSKDERIRRLIAEQSHGIVTEATEELQENSARADDRLEDSFRKLFKA